MSYTNPNPNLNPNYPLSIPNPNPNFTANTNPCGACAACKYQRRKCSRDCVLAPYFPANQQDIFLNAHRQFGVSNILKIIRGLDRTDRDEAMKSIIYESNSRAFDPVFGCYKIKLDLKCELEYRTALLVIVDRWLELRRWQYSQYLEYLQYMSSRNQNRSYVNMNPVPQQQQQQCNNVNAQEQARHSDFHCRAINMSNIQNDHANEFNRLNVSLHDNVSNRRLETGMAGFPRIPSGNAFKNDIHQVSVSPKVSASPRENIGTSSANRYRFQRRDI